MLKRRRSCWLFVVLSVYLFSTFLLYHRSNNNSAIRDNNNDELISHSSLSFISLHVDPDHVCEKSNNLSSTEVFCHWKYINETSVSGGGGAAILTCLIQSIHSTRLKDHRSTINICKTISLFQEAAIGFPSSVISLDKFNQPYQLPIYRHFNETFSICNCSKLQDRVNPYPIYEKSDLGIGDSSKTVPNYLSSSSSSSFQCDILHGSSLCPTDNIDLVENLPLWGFIDINWNEYIARSGRLLWPTCTMEETTKEGLHNQYRLFQRRQCN